jgi:hypothetical protein
MRLFKFTATILFFSSFGSALFAAFSNSNLDLSGKAALVTVVCLSYALFSVFVITFPRR